MNHYSTIGFLRIRVFVFAMDALSSCIDRIQEVKEARLPLLA